MDDGFGHQPETEAWQKLVAWAKPNGLRAAPEKHRLCGFNTPSPSSGSPNYGDEFWIMVGSDVTPEGEVEVKTFPGGLYAVTRCDVRNDLGDSIPATWKQLVRWREQSRYRNGRHQWLPYLTCESISLNGAMHIVFPW